MSETMPDGSPLRPNFITALVTPMREDDSLHEAGLEQLIHRQAQSGIGGLLVAGSMGSMQLLPDATYRRLIECAIEYNAGRMELIAGAGDTSYPRTRDRILFLNTLALDGVIVLTPYFYSYTQAELRDYFRALADISRHPLYLYDLPQVTRTKLHIETVLELSLHPNIAGIKCSDEPSYARQLADLIGDRFRVVMAAARLIDVFLRYGIREHLDGTYCLFPHQVVALGRAAAAGDWTEAARIQQEINRVMRLLVARGIWPAFAALMRALELPGRFDPRPFHFWDAEETRAFLAEEETQRVLRFLQEEETVM